MASASAARAQHWRFLNPVLHWRAFLVAPHLGIFASHHAEHRFLIFSDKETFSTGLRGGLRVFYIVGHAVGELNAFLNKLKLIDALPALRSPPGLRHVELGVDLALHRNSLH